MAMKESKGSLILRTSPVREIMPVRHCHCRRLRQRRRWRRHQTNNRSRLMVIPAGGQLQQQPGSQPAVAAGSQREPSFWETSQVISLPLVGLPLVHVTGLTERKIARNESPLSMLALPESLITATSVAQRKSVR